MTRRSLRRGRRGQFLILAALGIVAMMIALASILAYTSVSTVRLEKRDFGEVATQTSLNFRRALAISLAGVSKDLDFRASVRRYINFTTLEEWPRAKYKGYEFLTSWQNTTLMGHPGLGLNLTISTPAFMCRWNSSQGYSMASANLTLDIINYGFYGWKDQATVELNATIMGLNRTDGNVTSFYLSLERENGIPVCELTRPLVRILFQEKSGRFNETASSAIDLAYFGEGCYLVSFATGMMAIPDGLNLTKAYIQNMTEEEFKEAYRATAKEELCGMVDQVIDKYNSSLYAEAYSNLTGDIRPKLDPADPGSWVNATTANTTHILSQIDQVRSQLVPKIKIILQDLRGVVAGAYTQLIKLGDDTVGPRAYDVSANPNPTRGVGSTTLKAKIDDLATGWSNIAAAEYFVGTVGADGTGTPMAASDGAFDSPAEEVRAQLNVTGWPVGNYTIYVHGRDASGWWGNVSSVDLAVTETSFMYVSGIGMSLDIWRWGWLRYVRGIATVTIMDTSGSPVEGATVYGHWSGSVSGNVFGVTDDSGRVTFPSNWRWRSGTFTFTVDNVILSGYTYNPSLNVETSDTISG